jgi:hypothetical protein
VTLSLETGVLALGRPGRQPEYRIPAQFLGLFDPRTGCWQWGWITAERGGTSPEVFSAARSIHDHGVAQDIPELKYAQIPLGREDDRPWLNADYMAMASANLCRADCYFAMPVPGDQVAWSYWLVTSEGLLSPPTDARKIFATIRDTIQNWGAALAGSDGRAIIRAYAEARNLRVTDEGANHLRIETPTGGHLLVALDQNGDITGLDLPAGTKPGRSSWLSRLFGG